MSLVLEGTLADVGLCDLLQLIAREKRSGALRVAVDGRSFTFALHEGRLTGVRGDAGPGDTEPLELEPAVALLVRHRRGTFRLEPSRPEDAEGEGDASAGVRAEVLAGLGQRELSRLSERLGAAGGEDSRPERDVFPTPAQMEALDEDARTVFALVNGERDLAELIVRSRLDPLRVLDALEGLAADSLVRLGASGGRRRAAAPAATARAPWWRDGLAALLPLVVLGAWVAFAGAASGPATADPFAIREDPLAAARASSQAERLRAALEAHRFAEGRLPEQLATLVQRGYLPADALTDEHGRPYYYARRGDGFVLLAPER